LPAREGGPDGTVALLNRAWDALGYRDEELVGRPFCDLIALERRAASSPCSTARRSKSACASATPW